MGSCLSCRKCQRYFYYIRARRALKSKNRRVGGRGNSIEFNDLIDVNDGVLDDFALAADCYAASEEIRCLIPKTRRRRRRCHRLHPASDCGSDELATDDTADEDLSDQEEALRVEGSFDPAVSATDEVAASVRPLIGGGNEQRFPWQQRLQQQQRVGSEARLRGSSAAGQLSPTDSDERRSLDLDWDHEPEMLSSLRRSNLMLRSATEEDLTARALAREAEAEVEAAEAAEAAADFDLFPGQTAAEAASLSGSLAEAPGEQLLLPAEADELEWSHEFDTGGFGGRGGSLAASAPANAAA
uniref:Uncharacterized protein n=1 Tax=Macrostomum lignano TaxID=282301 RepID=A0A1I8GLV0_9PLAT